MSARAKAWVGSGSGPAAKVRKHKMHRVKIHSALLEVDNALQYADGSGPGLKPYQRQLLPDGSMDLKSPLSWPRPAWNSDQGSDMWGGVTWFEEVGRGVVHRISDPSHGVFRDTLGGVFDVKLGPFMYIMALVLNVAFLPFRSGKYGKQMQLAMQQHKRLWTQETSPFFLAYWQDIARDKQVAIDCSDVEFMGALWDLLHESELFSKMGSRIGVSRFYQFFRSPRRLHG